MAASVLADDPQAALAFPPTTPVMMAVVRPTARPVCGRSSTKSDRLVNP
jgi:hypothetical protein